MKTIFQKIRRYFNPTFLEWLEDFDGGFQKELENPKVRLMLNKILIK